MNRTQKLFNISKKAWAGVLTVLLGATLSLPAAASDKQVMNYDVYAGGFHVVLAELTVDTSKKGRYELMLESTTRGFLDRLVRWKGIFGTQGWRNEKAGSVMPEKHYSESWSRDDYERKTYLYGRDGSFKSYMVEESGNDSKKSKPVEKELTHNTTDALSATLAVMQKIATGGKCEGSEEIFDGSRRYRLVFRDKGTVDLKPSRYNLFSGAARECSAEVEPLAGKWHDKPRGWMSIQEQGRKAGTMPTVWFAQMEQGQPAVPVRIRVKTDYGTLFMHLTGYRSASQKLALN